VCDFCSSSIETIEYIFWKGHVCLSYMQRCSPNTSNPFTHSIINMGTIESITGYRKLQFYGQLCRLPLQYLAKNIFHYRLLRYINNNRQCLGFCPGHLQTLNTTFSIYTRLLYQRRDLSIEVRLENYIDQ